MFILEFLVNIPREIHLLKKIPANFATTLTLFALTDDI